MSGTEAGGKIGFLFHMGHGHYTQFLNFQECFPPEHAHRAEWIGLYGDSSGDLLSKLPFLPQSQRYARNQMWHLRAGLARHAHWDALFWASENYRYLPFVRRYRSYFYLDTSPSLVRQLGYDPPTEGNLLRAIKVRLLRKAVQESRGVFTMSYWAAKGIAECYGVPPERMHVAHPGANLRRWHFVDRSDRPAHRPVRILMVGGWFRLKGGPLLLEWAERTSLKNWEMDMVTWPGQFPEWVDQIVGNPDPHTPTTHSLAPRLPQVRIHCGIRANTPEILRLYEQADIFCLPTQADASSIASLEAMASGLPVVVNGIGGIPELIKEGVTGFLAPRHNPEELLAKLEMLIQDAGLRLKIGRAARQSCEEYYYTERQLREIISVIDRDITHDRAERRAA